MALVYSALALAAVTVIYLFWRSYISVLLQRRQVQRERVAYMLWVMAEEAETPRRRVRDGSPDLA
jgi:hypothetical protein